MLYDGGDQIGTSAPIAVTRAGWALDPGTLLAGAVEVYPTDAWGTAYLVPMGQDSPLGENFAHRPGAVCAERCAKFSPSGARPVGFSARAWLTCSAS